MIRCFHKSEMARIDLCVSKINQAQPSNTIWREKIVFQSKKIYIIFSNIKYLYKLVFFFYFLLTISLTRLRSLDKSLLFKSVKTFLFIYFPKYMLRELSRSDGSFDHQNNVEWMDENI